MSGLRIGYISGGDSDPFVLLVTNGVRDEAAKAGVVLSECDSNFAAETVEVAVAQPVGEFGDLGRRWRQTDLGVHLVDAVPVPAPVDGALEEFEAALDGGDLGVGHGTALPRQRGGVEVNCGAAQVV